MHNLKQRSRWLLRKNLVFRYRPLPQKISFILIRNWVLFSVGLLSQDRKLLFDAYLSILSATPVLVLRMTYVSEQGILWYGALLLFFTVWPRAAADYYGFRYVFERSPSVHENLTSR